MKGEIPSNARDPAGGLPDADGKCYCGEPGRAYFTKNFESVIRCYKHRPEE